MNKQCKVLVIGVGSIGERHVHCFQQTGRAIVSICEPNDDLRDHVAHRYGISSVFRDIDTALTDPPDAVVVATPAHVHIAIARQAIDAGCHVLIEKPLSVSLDGIAELQAQVARKGRIAAVAYVYRTHPALASMRQAIIRGDLGKPMELVAVAGQSFATYRPQYRDTYYANRATGGGAIQDALTHIINAGEWLVGPIHRLVADADHKLIDGVTVEDVVHVLARHGDVPASYALNQFQAPNEVTITIVCERGIARFEYHNHRWRCMLQPDSEWDDHTVPVVDRNSPFIAQANSFLDALLHRNELLCDLADGIQTLRVNLAALRSLESQSWQDVKAV